MNHRPPPDRKPWPPPGWTLALLGLSVSVLAIAWWLYAVLARWPDSDPPAFATLVAWFSSWFLPPLVLLFLALRRLRYLLSSTKREGFPHGKAIGLLLCVVPLIFLGYALYAASQFR